MGCQRTQCIVLASPCIGTPRCAGQRHENCQMQSEKQSTLAPGHLQEWADQSALSPLADAPFWQHPGHLVFLPAVPARFTQEQVAETRPHTAVNGAKDPKVVPVNSPDAQPGARRRNPSAVQLLEQPAIYRGSSLWCAAAFSLLQFSNQHIYAQSAKSASIVTQHRAVGALLTECRRTATSTAFLTRR